jgi:aminopeptidase N
MHSLRFILGDSLFLHTLKSFATDSGFSYGFATTDDFIKYFSASNPENIIPFIRMMLYTTDYPVFEVDKVKEGEYGIRLTNTDFELPVEIEANGQLINLLINQNRQIIECDSMPAIDPKNWYLKKTVSPEK